MNKQDSFDSSDIVLNNGSTDLYPGSTAKLKYNLSARRKLEDYLEQQRMLKEDDYYNNL